MVVTRGKPFTETLQPQHHPAQQERTRIGRRTGVDRIKIHIRSGQGSCEWNAGRRDPGTSTSEWHCLVLLCNILVSNLV